MLFEKQLKKIKERVCYRYVSHPKALLIAAGGRLMALPFLERSWKSEMRRRDASVTPAEAQ